MLTTRRLSRLTGLVKLHPAHVKLFSTIKPPSDSSIFKISPEVREALETGSKPVVALETTIYTHGFPHPQNKELAIKLESVVRENGGVPATIGILRGVCHVGMSLEELDTLLTAQKPLKISRRDFAYAMGSKLFGATTIAGTMVLARKVSAAAIAEYADSQGWNQSFCNWWVGRCSQGCRDYHGHFCRPD
jgi:Indigoidine synthase A like protein